MNDGIMNYIMDIQRAIPSVSLLFIAMLLDFCMGVTVAFRTKQLSSSASSKGMTKKVGTILLVMTGAVIDKAIDVDGNFVAKGVAMAFLVSEVFSILENASKLEIEIPSVLRLALIKLRPESEQPKPAPQMIVQHASNVNMPTMQPADSGINIHQDPK